MRRADPFPACAAPAEVQFSKWGRPRVGGARHGGWPVGPPTVTYCSAGGRRRGVQGEVPAPAMGGILREQPNAAMPRAWPGSDAWGVAPGGVGTDHPAPP
jgi:hypothetical protein